MADPIMLRCFLDGDSLCIIGEHFVDQQESDVVFVTLGESHINLINTLASAEGRQFTKPVTDLRLFVAEKVDRDIVELEDADAVYREEIDGLMRELEQLRDKREGGQLTMKALKRTKHWFDTHPDG